MARQATTKAVKTRRVREPVTRERALRAAVDIADAEGISSLTMRRLASELGVEAMSLYHHVANKDAVLDGITDPGAAERDGLANRHARPRDLRARGPAGPSLVGDAHHVPVQRRSRNDLLPECDPRPAA